MEKQRFNFLKWALVLGIVIVLNLFISSAIRAVYPEPQYQDYCVQEQVTVLPKTEAECTSKGGAWTEGQYYPDKPMRPVAVEQVEGSCDIDFTCRKEHESASDMYRRNVFIARVIFGVLAIGASFMIAGTQAVALGFSFGGVLSLVIATVQYWSKLSQYAQVIVLALALAVLIWLGVKKIQKDE